jgi:hypothetical protein
VVIEPVGDLASGREASQAADPTAMPRVWWSRRTVIVLLVIQVALAVVALGVWIWTPDAPALPPIPRTTAPLDGSGATLESALPLAQAQADAWLPDAVLLNASMQVDWPWTVPPEPPTEIPGTGWISYAFLAPWYPPGRPAGGASLSVVVERLSGAIVSQETDGWEQAPQLQPPPPASPVDSSAATLVAEAAGGTAFRRACPQYRHLSRTIPVAAGRTKWPQNWIVIYEDSRQPSQHGLLIRIDATTGTVLEQSGAAPDCPAP